jgi:hypothetical protein
LIIGGSDSSGIRAFVDAVRNLGVQVVADDKETFHVHGAMMFRHSKERGWPMLLNLVLNVTHFANYEWGDLPEGVAEKISKEVSTRHVSTMKQKGRVEARKNKRHAGAV